MPTDLKIDVTNRTIEIWSYNVETIIAEKYESIIKRSTLNTRIRDFYDVYMLIHLDKNNISDKVLKDAIIETSQHRETFDMINDKKLVEDVIESIKSDNDLLKQWEKYKKKYEYAKNIDYNELMESINKIKNIYFK